MPIDELQSAYDKYIKDHDYTIQNGMELCSKLLQNNDILDEDYIQLKQKISVYKDDVVFTPSIFSNLFELNNIKIFSIVMFHEGVCLNFMVFGII